MQMVYISPHLIAFVVFPLHYRNDATGELFCIKIEMYQFNQSLTNIDTRFLYHFNIKG
jgi:hypothetical protein